MSAPEVHPNWPHFASVARRNDGNWGVFCNGCTERDGNYVYPCTVLVSDEWPPAILYEEAR